MPRRNRACGSAAIRRAVEDLLGEMPRVTPEKLLAVVRKVASERRRAAKREKEQAAAVKHWAEMDKHLTCERCGPLEGEACSGFGMCMGSKVCCWCKKFDMTICVGCQGRDRRKDEAVVEDHRVHESFFRVRHEKKDKMMKKERKRRCCHIRHDDSGTTCVIDRRAPRDYCAPCLEWIEPSDWDTVDAPHKCQSCGTLCHGPVLSWDPIASSRCCVCTYQDWPCMPCWKRLATTK